ncbi:helix-turn-helix domain containing protein [Crossiella sp. CA-258035]|uniref:TetR/AcrR family transcriptional regulator n=1 Tax=Crossiella sp. CA-258035 TaxID=2981138 RepID=UPI0024BBF364|nr:TetR/AcrR family transcriptional regulator [Crossiella sp. CA-258035]WHT15650.1 helix-turn-helix domain containing protein [Crossiella sp. CA-258035]
MAQHQRADARRNYAHILAVATAEVAAHGANASLEQIARLAGVGSATVRRHFPTRRALLEAVSRERIEALCRRARELSEQDSQHALADWLGELVGYCVSARGLAAALAYDAEAARAHESTCSATVAEAAEPLLRRAVRERWVPAGLTVEDLITLAVGIALATEEHPDPAGQADRLLRLAVTGLGPPR